MAQERLGGGGSSTDPETDDAPSGARRAVEETPDEQAVDQDSIDDAFADLGSDDSTAETRAQEAVEQTPEPEQDTTADTTDTGASGAVEQTPDDQVDVNASVDVREQREQQARRQRDLEDATPGASASDPSADQPEPQPDIRQQFAEAGDDVTQAVSDAGQDVVDEVAGSVDDVAADETRDFGDTAIENPVTGNRVERDLNQATARLAAFAGERAQDDTFDYTTAPQRIGEFVATEAGNEDAANFFRRNRRQVNRIQAGAGEALLTAPTALATAGKEGLETAGSVAAGDASAEDVAAQAGLIAQQTGQQAVDNPFKTAGGLVGDVALSGGAGVALGRAARSSTVTSAVDRVRTAGGTRIGPDADGGDVVSQDVRQFYEGDSGGEKFPGADDPETYLTDPAAAVREQAADFTPDQVEQTFAEAGITEGSTLKKAFDVEPEGDGLGRGGDGVTTQEGDFESPGGFVGPELSPNFLRLSEESSPSLSLRPGLPSTGGRPTGALVRTRVRNAPDGVDTLDEFNEALLEAEGDTTARTKPASEVNTGEIEAVIPGDAQFSRVSSGSVLTEAARRLGIGSDFYTEIDGRRVPLRPVADPDLADGRRVDTDADSDLETEIDTGGVDGDTTTTQLEAPRDLDSYLRDFDDPVDRPTPVPTSSGGSGGSSSTSGPSGTGGGLGSGGSGGSGGSDPSDFFGGGSSGGGGSPSSDPPSNSPPGSSPPGSSPPGGSPPGGSPPGGSPPGSSPPGGSPPGGSPPTSSGLPGSSDSGTPPSSGPPTNTGSPFGFGGSSGDPTLDFSIGDDDEEEFVRREFDEEDAEFASGIIGGDEALDLETGEPDDQIRF